MSFEIEPKYKMQQSRFLGHQNEPKVLFDKRGVLMNGKMLESFGFKPKTGILILFDKKAQLVGFRPAMNAAESDAAYKLRLIGKNGFLACGKFTLRKLHPTYFNKIYKATLDAETGIVRVDLTQGKV
jgi:hypothetical protein